MNIVCGNEFVEPTSSGSEFTDSLVSLPSRHLVHIHRSQGLTLNEAIVGIGDGGRAIGLTYVA